MAVCAAFYMFFRAVMLPIAYTSLAKGDSLVFLFMEVAYDLYSFAFIAAGYYFGGITGTGVALSAAALLEVIIIGSFYSWRYGFRFFPSTLRLIFIQGALLAVMLFLCLQSNLWLKYILGTLLFGASAYYSFKVLNKKSSLLAAVKQRFAKRK